MHLDEQRERAAAAADRLARAAQHRELPALDVDLDEVRIDAFAGAEAVNRDDRHAQPGVVAIGGARPGGFPPPSP